MWHNTFFSSINLNHQIMKTILNLFLLIGLSIMLSSSAVEAQDAMKPKKFDNPQWKNVILIDYKPGMMNKARDLIRNYHAKASEIAGTPGPETLMILESGEYDMMAIWGMSGGISDMDWDISPNNIKWRKAMNELAGGADEALKIMQQYSSCINRTTNYLARID